MTTRRRTGAPGGRRPVNADLFSALSGYQFSRMASAPWRGPDEASLRRAQAASAANMYLSSQQPQPDADLLQPADDMGIPFAPDTGWGPFGALARFAGPKIQGGLDVMSFFGPTVIADPSIVYGDSGLSPELEAEARRTGVLPPEPGTIYKSQRWEAGQALRSGKTAAGKELSLRERLGQISPAVEAEPAHLLSELVNPLELLPAEKLLAIPFRAMRFAKAARPTWHAPAIEPGRITSRLSSLQETLDVHFADDAGRTFIEMLDNTPGVGQYASAFARAAIRRVNPSGVATNVYEKASFAHVILQSEAIQKAEVAMHTVDQLGREVDIWGAVDLQGFLVAGKKGVKGKHISEIAEHLPQYRHLLSDRQVESANALRALGDEIGAILSEAGIDVNRLSFEEGGKYVGRRVVGKLDPVDGSLIEAKFLGVGGPGAKPGMLKRRRFEDMAEAQAEGFVYLSARDTVYHNMRGALNQVAWKNFNEWILETAPWRPARTPEDLVAARAAAKTRKLRADRAASFLNRAIRGETLPPNTVRAIERVLPDIEGDLREATKISVDDVLRAARELEQTGGAQIGGIHVRDWSPVKELMRGSAKELDEVLVALRGTRDPKTKKFVGGVIGKLQKELDEIAEEAKRIGDIERHPQFGEAEIRYPGFEKKIFDQETASIISKSLDRPLSQALAQVNKAASVGRYYTLAGDMSPATIQLLFLAGYKPKIFGKAMLGMVRSMIERPSVVARGEKLSFHSNYMYKNLDIVNESPTLLLSGSNEFTETTRTGWMSERGPLGLFGKALDPFSRGFDTALDVAGIEMKKSLKHLAVDANTNMQVDAFINGFRGLADSGRLGVSTTQRQWESIILLAPRYNRAVASILFDLFRGNLRGHLARESLAKGVSSIAAMTVAIGIARGESEEEIADHLDPTSSNFVTWQIGGQNIGPGSKVRSVLRFLGKSYTTAMDDPRKMFTDTMENPNLSFMRGLVSLPLATGIDIVTGRQFTGDPSRDNLLQVSKEVIADNMMPFWLNSVFFEGGTLRERMTRGMGEFFGLRTYEQTGLQTFQNYAEGQTGLSWDEIDQGDRVRLRTQDETGRAIWQRHLEDQRRKGRENQAMSRFRQNEERRINHLSEYEDRVLKGVIRHSKFDEEMRKSGKTLYDQNQAEVQSEELKEFFQELDNRATDENLPIAAATRRYKDLLHDPKWEDPVTGDFLWTIRDRAIQAFFAEVGPTITEEIKEMTQNERMAYPKLAQEWYMDQENLSIYWDAGNAITPGNESIRLLWQEYLEAGGTKREDMEDAYPAIRELKRQKDAIRLSIRIQRPDIDALLVKWRGLKPRTAEGASMKADLDALRDSQRNRSI